MLGDFNEWLRGPATRVLTERLDSLDLRAHLKRRRTYPGFLPLLHLDHIYYRGHGRGGARRARRARAAR